MWCVDTRAIGLDWTQKRTLGKHSARSAHRGETHNTHNMIDLFVWNIFFFSSTRFVRAAVVGRCSSIYIYDHDGAQCVVNCVCALSDRL